MTSAVRCCLFALVTLSTTAAHADFVIKTYETAGKSQISQQSLVAPGVIVDNPHIDPEDKASTAAEQKVVARPQPVVGFGDKVPLTFACRQIVPKIYKVGYGPGVDRQALVDWQGGQTWPLVLGEAIKPLGLHMIWFGMNFEIRH